MNDGPLALLITWTVNGTYLPGDARGWRHRNKGPQTARPRLEEWHRSRLKYHVVLLDSKMRAVAEAALREICGVREWYLWALSVRTNHLHIVLTAPSYGPKLVRDQLKAKATTELRKAFDVWKNRPVWSAAGDIEFLDTEEEIEQCAVYVAEAQDRKDRDQ